MEVAERSLSARGEVAYPVLVKLGERLMGLSRLRAGCGFSTVPLLLPPVDKIVQVLHRIMPPKKANRTSNNPASGFSRNLAFAWIARRTPFVGCTTGKVPNRDIFALAVGSFGVGPGSGH